jgi:sn-glycerol 3-phosphate transport system substrate-binding protein
MKFKKKGLFIVILISLLVVAGCASTQKSTSDQTSAVSKDEAIELVWYYPIAVGGPLTSVIEKQANDFMVEYPHIKIKPVYTGSYADTMTKAQTAAQGGNPPELAVLLSTELYTLLDMDLIVPMDDFVARDGGNQYINDFHPAFMENAQTGGKTWSIPYQRSTIVLYYNKEAFAKAGLDPERPPATWDELIEYAQQLTIRENGQVKQWGVEIPSSGFPYWLFQAFALQNGKNLMSDDGKKVFFDTPGNVEALQFWLDLSQKNKVMPQGVIDWASVPSNFITGETAMAYHTTGNLTNIRKNANFDFGVTFLPANKQYGSPTGGGNFYIFKNIPEAKQEAAWTFIRWVTDPERAAQWSIDTGYVAVNASAYETKIMKDYINDFPPAKVARDQLQYASAELSTHNSGRVTKVFNDNLQAALVGSLTPAAALKNAQKEAETILAPFNK